MSPDDRFDAFYHDSRGALVHQTFALTGDLPAAQAAVREAYVAAWHHWRKVGRRDDPQDWVRPRAWQHAQRRHTTRPWHRNRRLSPVHRAVLEAVSKLSTGQRRTLLLTQLAGVGLDQAADEVGVSRATAEQQLQAATASVAVALDVSSTHVRSALASLAEVSSAATLPSPSTIRRSGRRKRRVHTVVVAAAAAAVAVASGSFVHQPEPVATAAPGPPRQQESAAPVPPAPEPEPREVVPTADELLDRHQIERLGTGQSWRVTRTHDNTSGNGQNTVCQQSRFADPDGISALVREFAAQGRPQRTAVQTIEVSDSHGQAAEAFDTTVGWYAGCQVARLQLLDAYRVSGVGDEARVLMVRVWDRPVTTYSVAVARIGRVVTTTVGETLGGPPPPPRQTAQSLADAASMLCATSGADDCTAAPEFAAVPPPPSGEAPGLLAVADLPPVGRIEKPWVGTRATRARPNPAATVCDRADFLAAGAQRSRTRTYLIPGARVPSRFGLSETYGRFAEPREARRFMDRIRDRMAGCEDRLLAATVRSPRTVRPAPGREISTWTLSTEVSEDETVHFRLALVRVGSTVAQLNFAPAPRADVSGRQFAALAERAGDRLRELG